MGVTYKLTAQTVEIVLKEKRARPELSCRALSVLLKEKLNLEVSKSAINNILKESGLSTAVARKVDKVKQPGQVIGALEKDKVPQQAVMAVSAEKKEEPRPPTVLPRQKGDPSVIQNLGLFVLKAADSLIGGSSVFDGALKECVPSPEISAEYLLYSCLSAEFNLDPAGFLEALPAQAYDAGAAQSYFTKVQTIQELNTKITQAIPALCQEARGIKVGLPDGNILYLDAQLRTTWPTPYIPYGFSSTPHAAKSYLKKCLKKAEPLVLFSAPEDDTPPEDFFRLLSGLNYEERGFLKFTLYAPKLDEIEVVRIEKAAKHFFIFALHPGQYPAYSVIKKLGDFKPFHLEPGGGDFYLAEAIVELSQPVLYQRERLQGCIVKARPDDKTLLVIASNLAGEKASPERLAGLYFRHWPNLEEGFTDFNRRIEVFGYTAENYTPFSMEELVPAQDKKEPLPIRELFKSYLRGLDLYARRNFLPVGYEKKDFSFMAKNFYNLSGRLDRRQENCLLITLNIPQGYPFLADLRYLCHRINEKEIILEADKRIWLEA